MPRRVADRSLVAVERLERPGEGEDIHGLLQQPVDVFVVGTARPVVLACQQVVERRDIDRIAVGLQQRAVVVAVHGELRVAMRVTPVDLVGLALAVDLIRADARHVRRLRRRHVVEEQLRLGSSP